MIVQEFFQNGFRRIPGSLNLAITAKLSNTGRTLQNLSMAIKAATFFQLVCELYAFVDNGGDSRAVLSAPICGLNARFREFRSWWSSGLEMTFVGAVERLVTYLIGIVIGRLVGTGA
jgi:hypothetical protein